MTALLPSALTYQDISHRYVEGYVLTASDSLWLSAALLPPAHLKARRKTMRDSAIAIALVHVLGFQRPGTDLKARATLLKVALSRYGSSAAWKREQQMDELPESVLGLPRILHRILTMNDGRVPDWRTLWNVAKRWDFTTPTG